MKCRFHKCTNEALPEGTKDFCQTHSRKDWYTVKEASKIWSVEERTVTKWIERRLVRAEKRGRQWLIPSKEFKGDHLPSLRPPPQQQPSPPKRDLLTIIRDFSLRHSWGLPRVFWVVLGLVAIGVPVVTPIFQRPPPVGECLIDPAYFSIQDGDGDGIDDEFLLDLRYAPIPCLPENDGVDLRKYDLEFTHLVTGSAQRQRNAKSCNDFPKEQVRGD